MGTNNNLNKETPNYSPEGLDSSALTCVEITSRPSVNAAVELAFGVKFWP
jgi:hypothetical protein